MMTTSVEDQISLKTVYQNLATKRDAQSLKADHERLATKTDLIELRTEIRDDMTKLQVSLMKWMVALVLGGMTGIVIIVLTVMGLVV